VEHLRKAAPYRSDGTVKARPAQPPESSPSLRVSGGREATVGEQQAQTDAAASIEPAAEERIRGRRPPVNWKWIMFAVFAISGLSGTGLLSYEYYQAFQQQRQQEAAARQKQQQQEEEEIALRAREEASAAKRNLARYIEQSRGAIANKNWPVAQSNLERAAAINPNHPAVTSVRAELLAAQQPGTRSKTGPTIRPASN